MRAGRLSPATVCYLRRGLVSAGRLQDVVDKLTARESIFLASGSSDFTLGIRAHYVNRTRGANEPLRGVREGQFVSSRRTGGSARKGSLRDLHLVLRDVNLAIVLARDDAAAHLAKLDGSKILKTLDRLKLTAVS